MTNAELLDLLRSMNKAGDVVVLCDGFAYNITDVDEDTDGTILIRMEE